jgi:hypothetical protein
MQAKQRGSAVESHRSLIELPHGGNTCDRDTINASLTAGGKTGMNKQREFDWDRMAPHYQGIKPISLLYPCLEPQPVVLHTVTYTKL